MTSKRMVRIAWILGGVLAALLLVAGAAIVTLRSRWFYDRVRAGIVNTVETATGGRVEISSLRFNWRTLRADLGAFVAATFAGLFVGTFFPGFLADRFGRRSIFTYALLCYTAATVTMAPRRLLILLASPLSTRFTSCPMTTSSCPGCPSAEKAACMRAT